MAEDFNRRALLEIDLDVNALNTAAAEAKLKVRELSDQMKILRVTGQENTAEYIALQGQMRSYQQVVTQAVNVNRQLTTAQNTATGSIDEMRAQLSVVTRQYNSLSAEERENIAVGGALLKQQKSLSDTLKDLEEAGGNNTRKVGQYREEVEKALKSLNPFESQLSAVVNGFNSLKMATEEQAAAQAQATALAEAAAIAAAELATAKAAQTAAEQAAAAAQAEVAALQELGTATAAQLAAAEQRATAATLELAAAQEVQSGAAATNAAANVAAAEGAAVAAGGFKLFDNILKASIIGAIAAIILLLIGYLKTFDPIVDKVEQAFAGLNAALDFVISSIKNVFTSFTSFGDLLKGFGQFLANPIKGIKDFANGMAQAAKEAANLKAAQQELEDAVRINEVLSAETAQRVAELILKARNRSLDNTTRKKYLDEAAKLDADNFKRTQAQANEEIRIATEAVRIKGRLNAQELEQVKKGGLAVILQLQGDLKIKGKITDTEIDMYKKAQLNLIAARDESTKRQEKIQNKIDADAEKASAEAEKRQAKLQQIKEKQQKADDEAEESRLRVAALSLSGRDAETSKIEQDFAKRITAAKGYSKLIAQLKVEETATLKALNRKFAEEDSKAEETLIQTKASNRVKAMQESAAAQLKFETEFGDGRNEALLKQMNDAFEFQKQADLRKYEFDLAQKDLTEQQKAIIDENYKQQELDRQNAFNEQISAAETALSERRMTQAKTEKDAIEEFEKQKSAARSQGLDLVQQIFGKQSAIGKAAFVIQKALALAEIVVQTQKQVAAINLAAAYQMAAAALSVPFPASLVAIAGIQAAATGKTILAYVMGGLQAAAVVAATVQGFAKGGVYTSDGQGGLLSGYSTHDNINAQLRSGEGILVSEAMRNPQARAAASQINVAFGGRPFANTHASGGFADGGIFSGQFSAAGVDVDQINKIIQQTAQAVAENMPQQILVIEDVQAGLQDKAYIAEKSTI